MSSLRRSMSHRVRAGGALAVWTFVLVWLAGSLAPPDALAQSNPGLPRAPPNAPGGLLRARASRTLSDRTMLLKLRAWLRL
jgi:hypothetical protein